MKSRFTLRRPVVASCLVMVVVALAARSVQVARDHVAVAERAPEGEAASVPFDVGQIMRQVHFAFRGEQDGWIGGDAAYSVVAGRGAFALTPRAADGTGGTTGVQFQTRSVRRGGEDLWSLDEKTTARDAQGRLFTHGHAITERLQNTPDGLEQSWELARAPSGRGDLVVRVNVDAPLLAETSAGLHFAAGGLAVRYGHATWVDAAGTKTPIPSTWDGTAIVLTVPGEVLASSSFPAVLDPLVSAEQAVDQPIYLVSTATDMEPSLAWNGSEYLLAYTSGQDILGVRLDSAGAALDPAGFTIMADTTPKGSPAVATNGTDFYVVWQDYRSSPYAEVYGSRVSAAGVVQDPGGDQLGSWLSSYDTQRPRVAFAGGRYLVVWTFYPLEIATNLVHGRMVDAATGNAVSGLGEFNIADSASWDQRAADVASDGTGFLVVWTDNRTGGDKIYGTRVTTAGAITDAPAFPITTVSSSGDPSVAWNGNRYLVTWSAYRAPNQQVIAALVNPATAAVTPNTTTGIVVTTSAVDKFTPAVTAFGTSGAGTSFLLAWTQSTDLYGARVTNAGTVSDTTSLTLASAASTQDAPALASNGTTVLVTWADGRTGSSDVWGEAVTSAGAVGAGAVLSKMTPNEQMPAVARGASSYLVVWVDTRNSAQAPDIYGARVNDAGVSLDPTGIAISTAAGRQSSPDVAYLAAADQFVVAWEDQRAGVVETDIYGARISAAGVVLDPAGLPVSVATSTQTDPATASDGTRVLVTWTDGRTNATTNNDIYGAFVSADAGVSPSAAAGLAISTSVGSQNSSDVAWNGGHFLVAWQDIRGSTADIFGTRLNDAGVVLDSAGVNLVSGPVGVNQFQPAIAASGATFLMAWLNYTAATSYDVYAGRFTAAGSLTALDGVQGFVIADGPDVQSQAAVASDGTNFEVVWASVAVGSPLGTILGNRVVAATRALLDGTGQVISPASGTDTQKAPAIASAGVREFLVAYQRRDSSPAFNTERVRTRRLSNAPPSATAGNVIATEDQSTALTLAGTDADGDTLSYVVQAGPTYGTLTGTPPNLTYAPAANYNGPDSFTFTSSDGLSSSTAGTVSITVNAVNDPPVAQAQLVSTPEDTAKAITLVATDVDANPLTWTIVAGPTHGSFSGTAPNLTYTPAADYNGGDSFTFKVNDGTIDSATVAVTLTITAVNDAPLATPQAPSTNEDTAVNVTLAGTDVDGNPLTFVVTSNPSNGVLTGTPPNLTYTPNLNTAGTDFFFFKANDGTVDSLTTGQVTLTVISVPDAPVAQNAGVGTNQDTPLVINFTVTDVDSTVFTYAIVTGPTNGTLSGSGSSRTYTPNTGYIGNDSFTFKANDMALDSNVATVNISVGAVNRPPIAIAQSFSTPEDTMKNFTLTGSDQDGDTLSFLVVTQPAHGTIGGTGANRTYTPTTQYTGPDSFTFKANDGVLDSLMSVTVTISVTAVNDAPVANPGNLALDEDSSLNFTLTASDTDGDALTFAVVSPPIHGVLTGTPPALSYQPNANYAGLDAITFKANDGTVDSTVVSLSITIRPVNDAPLAQPQSLSTSQDTPRNVTLIATDVDGDLLSYSILTAPMNGALSGTPPNIIYTPNAGYRGNDTFTFKATDGLQDSASASIGISVAAVNRPPVAPSQNVTVEEDTPLAVTLAATDQDADPITFALVVAPTRGTITGSGQNLTYTPEANFSGVDTFTFRANDGVTDSNDGIIRVTVTPVQDPPISSAQLVTTPEDSAVSIVLAASDVDGDALTWVAAAPAHGTVLGNAPNLTYTPVANFNGPDEFTFTVSDGTTTSTPVTVSIVVAAVNDAPVVQALSVSTPEGTPVGLTLAGSDVEGDALTFAVAMAPAHGAVSGTPPDLSYTPEAGFTGTDTFTFTANDGAANSVAATVTITVTPSSGGNPRATLQVNGWSCGCSEGGGSTSLWALAVLGLWAMRRRPAARGLVAVLVLVAPALSLAKPAAGAATAPKKGKSTPKAATPAPAPAPAEPVAEPPPPVVEAPRPVAPKGPPSLAALDVGVTVANEPLDSSAFTEMMTSAVDQSKLFKVISARDIATMLGVERQRQLLGCSDDTSCFTELADALGSEFVLQGTVGKVGDTYLITVRLIDSKRSRVAGRASNQTRDKNLLLNLMWKSTQQAIDVWGVSLPTEDAQRVAARPRVEPLAAVAPTPSKLGVVVAVIGGYQPLAPAGSRSSVGGEVAASWRINRLDLGAGIVISPTPGARIFGMFALLEGQHRISVGVRASAFPGAQVYGGGPALEYELGLGEIFGIRVLGAGEFYGSQQGLVVALLAGVGAAARF